VRIARTLVALVLTTLATALISAVVAAPTASAADVGSVGLTVTSATWTPTMTKPVSAEVAYIRLTLPNANLKIHVTTTVPGGVYTSYNQGLGVYCSADDDYSFTCTTTADPAGDGMSIQIRYQGLRIVNALGQNGSADYSTKATVVSTGETATGAYHVRTKADWRLLDVGVRAQSSTEFTVFFNAQNHGPSGGSASVTVTGFRTRSPKALPSGCKWSGALTVRCSYSGGATDDMSGSAEIPIAADERGCAYKVTVAGNYSDPSPSNNAKTIDISGPCTAVGGATPTPTAQPTSQPTAAAGGGAHSTTTPAATLSQSATAAPTATLSETATATPTDSAVVVAGPAITPAASTTDDTSNSGGHVGLIVGLVVGLIALAAGAFVWIRRRATEPTTL
jgi:hypothetical protein